MKAVRFLLLLLVMVHAAMAQENASPAPEGAQTQDVAGDESYLIPAAEIVGFELLLNRFDQRFIRPNVYKVTGSSIKHNLTHKWVIDNDKFEVNQFLHPYQGSVYHGFARSMGLGFWKSAGYDFAGSLLWEIAGETTPPAINDQISSGIGGPFLGEPLFRIATMVLERGGDNPGFRRKLEALLISPPTGLNHLAFGDRYGSFPSNNPPYFARLQLGRAVKSITNEGASTVQEKDEWIVNLGMASGLPGKTGYGYTRPFDYFDFEFSTTNANYFESITSRGLLIGTNYAIGDEYRGVWGLYGSYDYIAPQVFRVSNTALSLGTTAQWQIARPLALQGTVLAGAGYGAAGTIEGTGERDYHYGLTPQGLVALRLLLGGRASIEMTGRDYFVSRLASADQRGSENIARVDAAVTLRLFHRHAFTVKYVGSVRNARYPDLGNRRQSRGTVSLFYTILGDTRFGAVDWR
jgi:hypothetical protein